MKKSLSILLVLMLVLVPVTAMAEAGVSGSDTFDTNKQAETTFKVEVDTSNINVTVPLNLVFVANANGGALIAPAATAYQITNNSTIALKVESISTGTLSNPGGATSTPPTFSSVEALASGTNNVFYMTLNGQVLEASTPATSLTGINWNIPAKGTCGIEVVGSNTTLDFTTTDAAALFTVTYTIAPGTNPAS